MPSEQLWVEASCAAWDDARASYRDVLLASGGDRLLALDRWYHQDLPREIEARSPAHVELTELVRAVEWKMHRGVYRARNLALARANEAEVVTMASREAFAAVPHPTEPIARLARLKGVGPATASALLSAYRPDVYPFFDDVVATEIPDLAPVGFTLKGYAAYAERLRQRAALLAVGCPAGRWTAHALGCALWAAAGGKMRS